MERIQAARGKQKSVGLLSIFFAFPSKLAGSIGSGRSGRYFLGVDPIF